MLTALLLTGNNRFPVVNCEGKLLDNGTNTSINRMESNGKFWIVLLENVGKRSHNFAFSKSENSFSNQLNTTFCLF